ncbi:MAG: AraC family transcriptional regulator [Chryseobacterium sp.]|nr:MAG: AraC family transcriptional regulator [Chryseobacterium sp.]
MHPIFLIVVGAIFIFFTVISQLFIYRNNKRYLNLLLAITILGIMWYGMIFLLTNSGHIKDYPVLYNKGLPLYYLMAPCLFLYFRGSLYPQHSVFKRSHLWHIIPALPALISILPYNLLSRAEQRKVVEEIVEDISLLFNPSPYIVGDWHWLVFPSIATGYCIGQFMFIRKAQKQGKFSVSNITWLYIFTAIWTLFFLSMLTVSFRIHYNVEEALETFQHGKVVFFFCFCMLMLSFLFFLNPEFIYGLKSRKNDQPGDDSGEIKDPHANIPERSQVINGDKLSVTVQLEEDVVMGATEDRSDKAVKSRQIDLELVERIEAFIIQKEIFRQSGLTLSELASLCDLPNHKLTELINGHYKMTFNNYINSLRINYVIRRLDKNDWKLFTLEAIASDAGFLTRNTFFVAFKKNTGITPSAYVADRKRTKI